MRATRNALDAELAAAEEALGGSNSPAAAATNSGVIVFREGLEAVLILAALMASFKSADRQHLRKPMWVGALLALVASIVTWLILRQTISLFASFGEKLEAVVSLVAIGVLFLITNWFFHDVYWTGALAKSHKQKQKIVKGGAPEAGEGAAPAGRFAVLGGQFAGLLVLGFTSVYREGFETALFLQALTLEAGPVAVAIGALAGFALVALIGAAIFVLQAKLPVMRMLVLTGIMIGAVLLIMVGKTAHTMQLVGWLALNPIRWLPLPYWSGIWFGAYATWEGLGLQFASAVFVIGSYFLAEAAQKRKTIARRRSA
jgi:high-affinity iron transporter